MSTIHASFTGHLGHLVVIAMFVVFTSSTFAREYGVDVSHHQGSTGISQSSWNAMAAAGKQFAYIKATEGLNPPGNIDPAWPNNTTRASAAGILSGVYHYARPDNRPTTAGAIQEADHFVATAGGAMSAGHLRPVIDLEEGYFGEAAPLTPTALAQWVMAFVGRVVELKGPAAEPIVYASTSYASILDPTVPGITGLDAWIVSLNGQNPETGGPSSDGVFDNWMIWQYSHSGSVGGISPLDLNVFHSELAPLSSIVIPEPGALALLGLAPLCVFRRARRR